jgi:hypothetical protein
MRLKMANQQFSAQQIINKLREADVKWARRPTRTK